MDFPTILVLATLITGLIWALDAIFWAPRRRALAGGGENGVEQGAAAEPKMPVVVEYAKSFFPIILIVLLLRSFVVEPFRIPSASMMPTLLVGDFILVNKYAYGLRLPITNTKFVAAGAPARGDVVVFRYPVEPSLDYIKRVIGVPGDRIEYRDKMLYINGVRMDQELIGPYDGPMPGATLWLEKLNDVQHHILRVPRQPAIDVPPRRSDAILVPPGHYFVMGDNRDNSNDSRFWGVVPEENLVGKAFFVWMSWDIFNAPPAWDRIGETIK